MNFDNDANIDLDIELDIDDELLDDEHISTRQLLYISAPKHIFDTPQFNKYLAKIFADYSDYDIKICKYEFDSTDMWANLWLHLCLAIDKLIFVSDEHGYLGLGTYQEIRTVHAKTEILYLNPEMEYVPISDIVLHIVNNGYCLKHYANVLIKHDVSNQQ